MVIIPLGHKMRGTNWILRSHFVYFRGDLVRCAGVQKITWLKGEQMEIQHILLQWMLDFDLERAEDRLSVSSSMFPLPHCSVIHSNPGQLWLRERVDGGHPWNMLPHGLVTSQGSIWPHGGGFGGRVGCWGDCYCLPYNHSIFPYIIVTLLKSV